MVFLKANLKNHWKGTEAYYDIEQINTVIQKYLEVDVAIRLGKKYKDKFRILRISLSNESLKKQIMPSARKLRNVSNPDWMKRMFITPPKRTGGKPKVEDEVD